MKLRSLGLALLLGLAVGVGALDAQGGGSKPRATEIPEVIGSTTGALLDFLRYVPNEASFRKYLTYGDKAAWLQSWNVPNVPTFDALDGLQDQARKRWMFILPRQTLVPNALSPEMLATGLDMQYYGFDLFASDRYLSAGAPPDMITVVDGQFNLPAVEAKLDKAGYTASPLEPEGTLYSLRGDYENDLRADLPTAGKLSTRNRIALIGQRMLIANATPNIDKAVDAASGATQSLAETPEYQAAVAALDSPELADAGPLMGGLFIADPMLADPAAMFGERLSPEVLKQLQADFDLQPKLAPYVLSAFTSHHAAGKTSLVMTLVFSAGTDADAAAQALGQRIQDYTSVVTQRPFLDSIHAQFDRAFALEANGLPVAVVVLTADDPGPESTVVPDWSQAVFARDVGFLYVNP